MITLIKPQFKTNHNGGSAMRCALNYRLMHSISADSQSVLTATTFLIDDLIT